MTPHAHVLRSAGVSSSSSPKPSPLFQGYRPLEGTWDEYFDAASEPRSEAERVVALLDGLGAREFRARQKLADSTFLRSGVTFSVYSDRRGAERTGRLDGESREAGRILVRGHRSETPQDPGVPFGGR